MNKTTAPKSLENRTIVSSTEYTSVQTVAASHKALPSSTVKTVGGLYLKGKIVGQNTSGSVVLSINPQLARQQAIVREMNARLGGVHLAPTDSTDI